MCVRLLRALRSLEGNLSSDGIEGAIWPLRQVVHEMRAGDPMRELLSKLDDTHQANCESYLSAQHGYLACENGGSGSGGLHCSLELV